MKKISYIFSIPLIISLSFIFFIILVKKFNCSFLLVLWSYLIISVIIICIGILNKKLDIIFKVFIFCIIFICFFYRIINIEKYYDNVINTINNGQRVIGFVNSFPALKNNKLEVKLKVIGIKYSDITDYKKVSPFNILLKIKNPEHIILNRGDIITINKKISIPQKKIINFKYREYLFCHSVYGIIQVKKENIKIINNKINIPITDKFCKTSLWRARNNFIKRLKETLSQRVYSFLLSIFFGIRSELDEEIYTKFRNTGMVHLLAISGLHIGFIGILFLNFFRIFLSRSKSFIISIIILFAYIMLITPSASSWRAFFMYTISALFFITGICTSGVTVLSITAIILMFINPYSIFDLGFQFSFLATSGILLLSNPLNEKMPERIPEKIKSLITVTMSAFLSIFILQWSLFHKVPLFSLLSSIFIVPLFGILFSLLFFGILLFYITKIVFVAKVMEFLTLSFLKIIDILDIIPAISLPSIPIFISYLFLPLLVLLFYVIGPFLKKIVIIQLLKLK